MKEPVENQASDDGDDFRLEDFMPYRLSVTAEAVTRIISRQYLSQSGLGMSEWRLLAAVGRYGVLSPTAAGTYTSMDKVKVSRAAAALVGRGLLRQSQDPQDGRGRLLRLTRKGTTVFATIAPTARSIEADLAAGVTRAEWNTLQRTLGKLMNHTQNLLGDADLDEDA